MAPSATVPMSFRWLMSTTTTTGTSERSAIAATTPGIILPTRSAFTQASSGSSTALSDSVVTVDSAIVDSAIAGLGTGDFVAGFNAEGSAIVVSEAIEDFVLVDSGVAEVLAGAEEAALAGNRS